MATLSRVTDHVTARLNANTRSTDGTPVYSSVVGDKARSATEIAETCVQAAIKTAKAICESDGHAWRSSFLTSTALTHGATIPFHYGDTSIPVITPYSGAAFTLEGEKRSFGQIASYRQNTNNVYGPTAHNAANGTRASSLAGFYDIVNGIFYFTGFSAVMMLATFSRSDVWTKLPDAAESIIVDLAAGMSAKEGDTSDGLFQSWLNNGQSELNSILGIATVFPPVDQAVAQR